MSRSRSLARADARRCQLTTVVIDEFDSNSVHEIDCFGQLLEHRARKAKRPSQMFGMGAFACAGETVYAGTGTIAWLRTARAKAQSRQMTVLNLVGKDEPGVSISASESWECARVMRPQSGQGA